MSLQEFRCTFRQLAKSPVFTIVSIATIALGIGANTAVFSVMNAVLLRMLPVRSPERLVFFHLRNQPLSTLQSGYSDTSLSLPVFNAMRSRRDVFGEVIAFAPLSFRRVAVRIGAEPEEAYGEEVSGNYFLALGVQPVLGRAFTEQDESIHAPVAVLSYSWWRRRFGAAPDVVGRTVYVNSVPLTVAGVAPPDFDGTDPGQPLMDFWIPFQQRPQLTAWGSSPSDHTLYGSPEWLCLLMIGRLLPDVSPSEAAARLTPAFRNALAAASQVDPREEKPQLWFSAVRGVGNLREEYGQPLAVLLSTTGLILLIACANVALLLIARNSSRQRELALRQALGAGRWVLFRQLLVESLALVAAGSALGWWFAGIATEALGAWSSLGIPIQPDRQVLWFTLALSAAVALAFGLAPMRVVARVPLLLALRSATATSHTDRYRMRGRKLVIAAQIALSAVLLFVAGLFYRTLHNLESRDLGMRTAGLLVFGITPQAGVQTDAEAVRFHTALLSRLRELPGVDSATIMQVRMGAGGANHDGVLVDGRNPQPNSLYAPMWANLAGSQFLRTLGIPLRLGRDFTDSDSSTTPKVAIINQTFADRYLPGINPLGHHIAFFQGKNNFTIVGVAGNSRYQSVREPDQPTAYFPFTQVSGISGMQYELHTSINPRFLIPDAARLVHQVDPNLPLERPMTQQEEFARSLTQERLVARLSVFFGALAAFLISIGLYGTISYSVSRRTMEIGVRMALGAQRREVLAMILRESAAVAAAGVSIGAPAAVAAGRIMHSMLYGLSPGDPLTLLLALTAIAGVTLLAAILPARHAASLDAMSALRME